MVEPPSAPAAVHAPAAHKPEALRAVTAADEEAAREAEAARRAELLEAALAGRLRELIDAPGSFSFSAFAEFEHCPLAYAFKYICGLEPPEPVPAFAFGSAAHRAFELFTRRRRERAAAGEPSPTREDLDRCFAEAWEAAEFPDEAMKEAWFGRVGPMLDAFWQTEQTRRPDTVGEELPFRLGLELPDGTPVVLSGIIDRIDRRGDGAIELVDYKTGPAWGPGNRYNLQLAIYSLGSRDALGLGVPRRALLFFVEHSLFAVQRVNEQLVERTRAEVGERATAIRASDFAPTPSPAACRFCDFKTMCPARAEVGAA